MPEENTVSSDVKSALDNLEHHYLKNHYTRARDYDVMLTALNRGEYISVEDLFRLLAVCVNDLKDEVKSTAKIMKILQAVIPKVKERTKDLLPSALAVVEVIKSMGPITNLIELKILCFNTLLAYPNEIIITIVECADILEIFYLYCNEHVETKLKMEVCKLLDSILKILPPLVKRQLVERGLTLWFSKIIPTLMTIITIVSVPASEVETLELLTEEIVHFEYSEHPYWRNIMEHICCDKRYPMTIKRLLEKGSEFWHRLWIVYIKLLKKQLTQPIVKIGTPINSMLPIVESAFKGSVINRCRAFECWHVIIDSFYIETNETNIKKRLSLLMIPLTSNNAKVEETALAKFKCWWHLLKTFQNKIDKYLDTVLLSFLRFCFGKNNVETSVLIPGQISNALKKLCCLAMVDIFGHTHCEGCTELPKLQKKIINTKHLVDNWNQWIFSLTSTITITAKTDVGLTKQQMTCLWKSFLMTVGELPENNIRKDIFSEILTKLDEIVQECTANRNMTDIVLNTLILSLFEEDKIKQLLKTKSDESDPLYRLIKILLNPSFNAAFPSEGMKESVARLRPVTDMVVDPAFCPPAPVIIYLNKILPRNNVALTLWTALMESLCASEYDLCPMILCNTLMWPLKYLNDFLDITISALTWHKTYNLYHATLINSDIDKEVSTVIFNTENASYSATYFKLCVLLGMLKHKVKAGKGDECEREVELLYKLTSHIDNYKKYEKLFPIWIEDVSLIIETLGINKTEKLTLHVWFCIKKMLAVTIQTYNQQSENADALPLIENILQPVQRLLDIGSCFSLMPHIVNEVLEYSSFLIKQPSTKDKIISIMKTILCKMSETDPKFMMVKSIIDEAEGLPDVIIVENTTDTNNQVTLIDDANTEKDKFTTPIANQVKKAKKKEPSIVNTVVENGEEYVVVKSNWKFNPRKLTEKQKEKLQRKREDIPALYQDLSQSQDEFKLAAWKTDSQDTSNSSRSESTSCRSGDNEKATEILKNMQSSNVVPKILEAFFSENEKHDSNAKNSSSSTTKETTSAHPKSTKSSNNSKELKLNDATKNMESTTPKHTISTCNTEELPSNDGSMSLKPATPKSTKSNTKEILSNDAIINLEATTPKSAKSNTNTKELTTNESNKNLEPTTPKNSKSMNNNKELQVNNSTKTLESITPKNTKSPRLALKDRVFRNVRNLIENSEVQKENKKAAEDLNKTVNIVNTPTQTKTIETANVVNSAPPLLSADRPSRVKRKPKKFEELLLLDRKKKRRSLLDLNSADNLAEPIASKMNDVPIASIEINEIDSNVKNIKEDVEPVSCSQQDEVEKENEKSPVVVQNLDKSSIQQSDTDKVYAETDKVVENIDIQTVKVEPVNVSNEENKVNDEHEKTIGKAIEQTENGINKIPEDKNKDTDCSKAGDKSPETNNLNCLPQKPDNNDKNVKAATEIKEGNVSDDSGNVKLITTPQQKKAKGGDEQKSTAKKTAVRKSRIEKELAIDMVEGHPVLKLPSSEKRLTRKALESVTSGRRKNLVEKLNKSKSEVSNCIAKINKKNKEKNRDSDGSNSSVTVEGTQEPDSENNDDSSFSQETPYSDDVIESSQDSTMTSISVKSTKKSKKVPFVTIEKISLPNTVSDIVGSQSILEAGVVSLSESPSKTNQESKDDIELPVNKTVLEDKNTADLTENMDTEPIDERDLSEVIIINDDPKPLTISSEDSTVGPETQEIAEADTQPTDPTDFMDVDAVGNNITECPVVAENITSDITCEIHVTDKLGTTPIDKSINDVSEHPSDNITLTLTESGCVNLEKENGASSPSSFNDEERRKQDFMNNTLEISPIKNMSPDRNKKSPSPETSSDYVVIKLTSPVNSNGEPLEKCGSPEVFTDDKVSPDKRDQSPPRVEVSVTNTSPSSALSLKKNRPQVRSGGRAAQMLGLCVPDKVQAIVNPDKNETEEAKKITASSTPARRNLRMLYNAASENIEAPNENEESEHFLRFRRSLPTVDCSPSGPILKRKLVEISDDATVSPANKRKRVSFHDPPVSTTVAVQKYIEPAGLRSPQSSALRRHERLRQNIQSKSPKRLDHAFKLDTVLTKTIESFSQTQVGSTPDDTQPVSLDDTPVVEIVRASELNDTDPICPDLIDCQDPIENIAGELSSTAMKSLLVVELTGKVETVGDLAKMTELEVNRLCIKAPKVKVARKVLTDYAARRVEKTQIEEVVTMDEEVCNEPTVEPSSTPIVVDMDVQTDPPALLTINVAVQSDETGSKSTEDLIKSCLVERPDFVEKIGKQLQESTIQHLAENLPFNAITDVLIKKLNYTNSTALLNKVLDSRCNGAPDDRSKGLSIIRDFVCNRYSSQDLILFCSEVLKSVYDKPA